MTQPKPGTVYHDGDRGAPSRTERLSQGDVIGGHYAVDGLLGEGGMAVVYRATNISTAKPCAVKVLHAQLGARPEFMRLFAKEAKVGSVIGENPHVVRVYDAGLDEQRGIPFIVMELLEGQTLERVLEHGPLSPALACLVLTNLKSALGQAHRAGVVHRDLKPSNLLLASTEDGQPLVKVMDFGIAKVLEGEAVRTATQIGTPAYNAPEQMGSTTRKIAAKQGITIASGVSPATDVWAIGLLAYELFTGDLPGQYWGVETLSELPMKVAFEEHEPASVRAGPNAALLPAGFDGWFSRCLRKDAAERWVDADEAIGELLELIERSEQQLSDEELDAVSTRLYAPPAAASNGPPASTRSAESARRAANEPQALPPASSPAITVAEAPAFVEGDGHDEPPAEARPGEQGVKAKDAASSDGPVVRPSGRRLPPGVARWGRIAVLAVLVLGVAVVVGYRLRRTAGGAAACSSDDASATACQHACDAGSLEACYRLATRYQHGRGVTSSAERARDLYRRACGVAELGGETDVRAWSAELAAAGCAEDRCVPAACAALADGYLHERGGSPAGARAATALYERVCRVGFDDQQPRGSHGCLGLGRQRERAGQIEAARSYYGAACEDGLLPGCVALAGVLERGGPGWRDEKRARALYQKACDGGDLEGCTRLGRMVERGRGGWVADQVKAVGLYKRACDGGKPLGCVYLARSHRLGKGKLARDAVRALELLQKVCEGGELLGCARLAAMIQAGQGGASRDDKRAYALDKRACDGGSLLGCAQLGQMYLRGEAGLTKDSKEGRALIERACRGGEPVGCVLGGWLDAAALTGQELMTIFDKACEDGAPAGCRSLAELFDRGGEGVEIDKVRAAKLYTLACDDGSMRACTNLANLVYDGAGGEKRDPERSAELNGKACRGGDAVGCARLGILYAQGTGVSRDAKRAAELYRRACAGRDLPEAEAARCALLHKLIAQPAAASSG